MVISESECEQLTGLLADRLIKLAGTPDDSSRVETDLIVIAQLAAARIAAVDTASVTSRRQGVYATAAASSELAVAVDKAQYDDGSGPCLNAFETGLPTVVPEIATAMRWPKFRDTAVHSGLRASLSIPLFAGSGTTVATLNLYSRHPDAMTPLSAAICDVADPGSSEAWNHDDLDSGGRELAAGVIGALALRAMIQRSIRILMSADAGDAERAYLTLCAQAALAGTGLVDTAADVIEQFTPDE